MNVKNEGSKFINDENLALKKGSANMKVPRAYKNLNPDELDWRKEIISKKNSQQQKEQQFINIITETGYFCNAV